MSNTSPILYSFRRCPYAMRARLALQSSGVQVRLREILLKNKPKHLLQISPKGTIPVLQLSDERVIDESLDIMYWALAQSDPQHLCQNMSSDSNDLIAYNDGPFKHALDRYKYAERFPEFPIEHYRNQAMAFIGELEHRLSQNNNLTSDQLHFTDIAIFPFVRQFAGVDPAWFGGNTSNDLRHWLDRQLNSTLFLSIMRKYPQWIDSQIEHPFPE